MKQNKLMLILLMTGVLALMIPTSAPFAMADEKTTCNGTLADTTVGDVEIPTGADCTLTNVIVLGNVEGKEAPNSLTITFSEIHGKVQLKGATGSILITDNRIADDHIVDRIKISDSNIAVPEDDSKVSIIIERNWILEGNITLEKNKVEGKINIKNNRLEVGNIKLNENDCKDAPDPTTGTITVQNNKVREGNVQLIKNTATWFRVSLNDFTDRAGVAGNVVVQENIATDVTRFGTGIEVNGNGGSDPLNIEVKKNTVMRDDADMQVNNNEADGNIKVESNTVGGNIQVNGNEAIGKITVKKNSAETGTLSCTGNVPTAKQCT